MYPKAVRIALASAVNIELLSGILDDKCFDPMMVADATLPPSLDPSVKIER